MIRVLSARLLSGTIDLPWTRFSNGLGHRLMAEGPTDRSFKVGGVYEAELTLYEEMPRLTAGRSFPDAELHMEPHVR